MSRLLLAEAIMRKSSREGRVCLGEYCTGGDDGDLGAIRTSLKQAALAAVYFFSVFLWRVIVTATFLLAETTSRFRNLK